MCKLLFEDSKIGLVAAAWQRGCENSGDCKEFAGNYLWYIPAVLPGTHGLSSLARALTSLVVLSGVQVARVMAEPQSAAGTVLTIDDAVRSALQDNRNLKLAAAEVEKAAQQVEVARLGPAGSLGLRTTSRSRPAPWPSLFPNPTTSALA